MDPNSRALRVTRTNKPGVQFELVVDRFPSGLASISAVRLGRLKREVAVRDVNREPPQWTDAGDAILFAGSVLVPEDKGDAVTWMDGVASLEATGGSDTQQSTLGDDGAPSSAPTRLGFAASLVQGVGVILGLLSIVGGLFLALYTDDFDERPFVGAGVSSIVMGAVFWTIAYFAATFAEAWLETTERE